MSIKFSQILELFLSTWTVKKFLITRDVSEVLFRQQSLKAGLDMVKMASEIQSFSIEVTFLAQKKVTPL